MVKPPVMVNVGAWVWPGGMLNVTTTFCVPVVALDGMVKLASTVPWVASVELVAVRVPRVTLEIGALAGGRVGGFEPPVDKVMFNVILVPVPRLTLPPGTG